MNEMNPHTGIYSFDNNIDAKGEIVILHTGFFSGQITDYYGGTLDNFSGTLKGNNLLFDGNNSDVKVKGTVSGGMIKVHVWTSLYGDTYFNYYKKD